VRATNAGLLQRAEGSGRLSTPGCSASILSAMSSQRSSIFVQFLLFGAGLLCGACGERSGLAPGGTGGGGTATSSGGTTDRASGGAAGGATAISSGGTTELASGGAAGGVTAISSGGTANIGTGGAGGGSTGIPFGGNTVIPSGGTTKVVSSGGATAISSGGATKVASGGTTAISSGGTTSIATGGVAGRASGGASGTASGGTTGGASGGTGGASSTGGSTSPAACTGVICPSLPASCRMVIQDPTACCPICTDTGCDPCAAITCGVGTHQETLAGACCPTCVPDPPDPCTQGRQSYATARASMLEKYSSTKCQNSSDCTLLLESNACVVACNVALPSQIANSYQSNLASMAASGCATCPTPPPAQCEQMVPACMNGKCVAANPS